MALYGVELFEQLCQQRLADHVYSHLAVDILDRAAHRFAAGGWWTNSTLRTWSGSRWNVVEITLLSAVLIVLYLLTDWRGGA